MQTASYRNTLATPYAGLPLCKDGAIPLLGFHYKAEIGAILNIGLFVSIAKSVYGYDFYIRILVFEFVLVHVPAGVVSSVRW